MSKIKKHKDKFAQRLMRIRHVWRTRRWLLRLGRGLGAAAVAAIAGLIIVRSLAATYATAPEAETGLLTGPASRCADTGAQPGAGASGGVRVVFGIGSCDSAGKTYANPVAQSVADPGVLRYDGRYYLVSTSGCPCFTISVSDDLVHWQSTGKSVFNGDGTHPWGTVSFWAPSLHQLANGRFAVYYSAYNPAADKLQVGVATADNILGPYTDLGFPLVRESYGVIDANLFRDDDGRQYLYWKQDIVGSKIVGQEVDAAGTTVIGSQHIVLESSLDWEANGIEGPWIMKHDGMYYMFYSGNFFASDKYAVGIAKGNSPLGMFSKKGGPILTSSSRFKGPGHNAVVRAGLNDYMVYHAWDRNPGVGDRVGMVDKITWSNGWPAVGIDGHPSEAPQPLPQ